MMRRIDLLPERYLTQRKERRDLAFVIIAGVLVFLLLLTYWFVLGGQISGEKDDLNAAQQRNNDLRAEIAELQVFAELEAEAIAKRTALTTVMVGDIAWPSLLTELAMVIPGEVWLTQLTASAGATEGATPVGTETAPIRITSKTPVGRIQFNGSSLTMPGVAKWLIRQGTVNRFSAIWLNSATAQDDGSASGIGLFTFDSTLELSERALSDRYVEDLP